MLSRLLPRCLFHLRRVWSTQPVAACALAATAAATVIAGVVFLEQRQQVNAAHSTLGALMRRVADTERTTAQPDRTRPALRDFSSTQLLKALRRAADDSKLPLDEISFTLEDNSNQPYLRYRATLTATAGYPAIRRFVERLRVELADISLDAISCSRDDIGSADLSCDLTLSAFYRKGGRG